MVRIYQWNGSGKAIFGSQSSLEAIWFLKSRFHHISYPHTHFLRMQICSSFSLDSFELFKLVWFILQHHFFSHSNLQFQKCFVAHLEFLVIYKSLYFPLLWTDAIRDFITVMGSCNLAAVDLKMKYSPLMLWEILSRAIFFCYGPSVLSQLQKKLVFYFRIFRNRMTTLMDRSHYQWRCHLWL